MNVYERGTVDIYVDVNLHVRLGQHGAVGSISSVRASLRKKH